MTRLATDVVVGDIININTGYRPLDDDNCKVLDIVKSTGLFRDAQIEFFIQSYEGNHWTVVSPHHMITMGC